MGKQLEKVKKNKAGFTLVELVVVLVILSIVIAIGVPAFTGYMRKEYRRTALTEARQVVLSGQAHAGDEYGKGVANPAFKLDEVGEMSEVDGTVQEMTAVNGRVTYAKYKSAKDIVVIYEDDEYRVEGENGGTGGGTGDTGDEETGGQGGGNSDLEIDSIKFGYIDAKKYLEESGNGSTQINLPRGAYKAGDVFYYVWEGMSYNSEKIEGDPIQINLADTIETYHQGSGQVSRGDVCEYNGKYYVALAGGVWEPYPPSGNWGEIFPIS